MRLGSLFGATVFISLLATGSFAQKGQLSLELKRLILGAANTSDAREMDSLLTDDFTQADISDKGNSLTTKSRILRQLAEVPEVFRPFMEHVTTKSEITNLHAVQSGDSAVFTASLIARSTVQLSGKLPGKTVSQVERYEISGSATRDGSAWKLTSLRRTRTAAKDLALRLDEVKGNKAFDVAVFGLLLEGAAKAKAASPADFY